MLSRNCCCVQGNFIPQPPIPTNHFILSHFAQSSEDEFRYGWNLSKENIKQSKFGPKKKKKTWKNNSVILSLYSFLCRGHSEYMYMSCILVEIQLTKVLFSGWQFIQKPMQDVCSDLLLTIPSVLPVPLSALMYYLKQNMSQFSHAPNYADNKPENRFQVRRLSFNHILFFGDNYILR